MPTMKDFGSYKITLYAEDHVIGPDFQAKVRIADAEVFAGSIPARHRREALAWVTANSRTLMARWEELK